MIRAIAHLVLCAATIAHAPGSKLPPDIVTILAWAGIVAYLIHALVDISECKFVRRWLKNRR